MIDMTLDALMAEESPAENDHSHAILVVEDEEEVRKVICLTLQLQGYRVLAAATPQLALQIVHSGHEAIDLLLTDVVMPELSGPELAAKVLGYLPNLSVLYISGYADDVLLSHKLKTSEVAFLAKPFSSASLGRMVRNVLQHSRRV